MGTSGGTRVVLGHWPLSPFGGFSDVMIERPGGERLLLAPTGEIARFIAHTYAFDEVRVVPVGVRAGMSDWTVAAGPLDLGFAVGGRRPLGFLLRAVPGPVATHPAWAALVDLPARLLMPGVRTTGRAGQGRREWYGARDLRSVTALDGRFEGDDLGSLAPLEPPVRFGFGSAPRTPALVRVTTTVELDG